MRSPFNTFGMAGPFAGGGGDWRAPYIIGTTKPAFTFDAPAGVYGLDGTKYANPASMITFTRASTKTYRNSSGALTTAEVDEMAIDHNGAGDVLGLRVEGDATALLLNSATLSTQNVTVAAVVYVLHFTGTGTVTLTGVSTAGPLVGTGTGESNRVSLTFTPTAGTLTLTVSGTVSNAQMEIATQSSYIPTFGSTVTRAADYPFVLTSAFGYSDTVGTLLVEWAAPAIATQTVARFGASGSSYLTISRAGGFQNIIRTFNIGFATNQLVADNSVPGAGVAVDGKYASAWALNNVAATADGAAVSTDSVADMVSGFTHLGLGCDGYAATNRLGGHIKRMFYYPERLTNAQLITWST